MDIEERTTSYLTDHLPERPKFIKELETYAEKHAVPIMELDGMETLLQFLRVLQPKKILEIGTAIGYSAIRMLSEVPDAHIVTIERDSERANIARVNAKRATVDARFHLIDGDALDVAELVANFAPFDVLFIDATKGKYEDFFKLYEPMVKEKGLIFSDNVLFKGFVSSDKEADSRNVRAMVKKIRAYNKKIMEDPRFTSVIIPVGDGLLVSRKMADQKENGDGEKE